MKYGITLLLFFAPLFALEEAKKTTVESEVAHYEGNRITFAGNVSVESVLGNIFADQALLVRDEERQGFQAAEIFLKGNVKLVNEEKGQYALADEVEYIPEQEAYTFKGENGKRVLFYDQKKEIKLSAPMIKACRQKEDGKESVQGVGDVRLEFSEEELEKFINRFHWNPK